MLRNFLSAPLFVTVVVSFGVGCDEQGSKVDSGATDARIDASSTSSTHDVAVETSSNDAALESSLMDVGNDVAPDNGVFVPDNGIETGPFQDGGSDASPTLESAVRDAASVDDAGPPVTSDTLEIGAMDANGVFHAWQSGERVTWQYEGWYYQSDHVQHYIPVAFRVRATPANSGAYWYQAEAAVSTRNSPYDPSNTYGTIQSWNQIEQTPESDVCVDEPDIGFSCSYRMQTANQPLRFLFATVDPPDSQDVEVHARIRVRIILGGTARIVEEVEQDIVLVPPSPQAWRYIFEVGNNPGANFLRWERGRVLRTHTVNGRRTLRADVRSSFSMIRNNPIRVEFRFEPFAGGPTIVTESMIRLEDDGLGSSRADNVEISAPPEGRYRFSATAASVRTTGGQSTISHLSSDVTVEDAS